MCPESSRPAASRRTARSVSASRRICTPQSTTLPAPSISCTPSARRVIGTTPEYTPGARRAFNCTSLRQARRRRSLSEKSRKPKSTGFLTLSTVCSPRKTQEICVSRTSLAERARSSLRSPMSTFPTPGVRHMPRRSAARARLHFQLQMAHHIDVPHTPAREVAAPEPEAPVRGLSQARARELLERDGPNEIVAAAPPSPLRMFGRQFQSPVVALLLAACGVSALLGEALDGLAIGVVVVLNAFVGFLQEYRAEAAVQALRNLTARRARVLRDGAPLVIPASEVVVGDALALEAGDVVAADARVLEAHLFSVNQASLTGESEPVAKSPRAVAPDAPLIEQSDRVFMGSSVARGSGLASVVAIGMRAELGRIAHLVDSVHKTTTPLEARLARVTRSLIY